MTHGEGTHGAGPTFDVVLRGYDRRQVDDHLASLEGRLAATSGQCNELRLQRDAAAGRVHELEQRLNGASGVNALSSTSTGTPGQPPAVSETVSLDGFGAKVEAILRLATEEAAAIRRAAADSTRVHAQAEGKLRATFESVAQRLAPLAERLDEESKSARSALPGVTNQATSLEATAREQARLLTEAAAANATRLRADAQARAAVNARQVADVREELALVKQILTSLGAPPATGAAAQSGTAPNSGGQPRQPQDSGQHSGPTRGQGQQTESPGSAGPQSAPAASRNSTQAGGPASVSTAKPSASRPSGADTALSPEAPTETIALPPSEPKRESSGSLGTRPSHPPS